MGTEFGEEPSNLEKFMLKVQKARPRDENRFIARIPAIVMEQLKIKTGDIVLIKGSKETPAIAWPGYPQDLDDWLRIDTLTQENAGAVQDELVSLWRPKISIASMVSLVSQSNIKGDKALEKFAGRKLDGIPVNEGMYLIVSFGIDRTISFQVLNTEPQGVVVVRPSTHILLHDMERADDRSPPVHLQQLQEFLKLGTKFRLDDIAALMGTNRLSVIMKIIDWSKHAKLEIDGDFLIINDLERIKLLSLLDASSTENERKTP